MNEVYSTNTRPRQEEQYLSTVTEMGDRNRLLLQDLFFFFFTYLHRVNSGEAATGAVKEERFTAKE